MAATSSRGAETVQEYLDSGLIGEFSVTLGPVLFGTGIRLFDHVDPDREALANEDAACGPGSGLCAVVAVAQGLDHALQDPERS